MAEEESFVILGSTPTPSMEAYTSMDGLKADSLPCDTPSETAVDGMETSSDSKKKELIMSAVKQLPDNSTTSIMSDDAINIEVSKENSSVEIPSSESFLTVQKNSNLAASFLLGEIPTDVLKSSIYTQFPSLCTADISTEDSLKLQNFMCEYVELKKHLQLTNATMRRHFSIINEWQNENKAYKKEQKREMEKCHQLIEKLQKENEELREELNTKIDQVKLSEEIIRKDSEDLIKLVSEKTSLINNMSVQIEKLEQERNASFDYVTQLNVGQSANQYFQTKPHAEHFNMKQLKDKLSEIAAQNLELQDMRKIYTDEINCLKVNLTSAEELLKKAYVDINTLKIKNDETSQIFKNYELEKNEMKEEIDLLKAQLTLYRKDFESERTAREELVNKNKLLLEDLKIIQQRNQELLEEAERRMSSDQREDLSITNKPSSTKRFEDTASAQRKLFQSEYSKVQQSPGKEKQVYSRSEFLCPLCNASYKELAELQIHVQDCIDKA